MDRRQQKTRKAIFQAFTELLETKSYSNITVQEIIDKADIGRSTFYSHFETKDNLLKAICTEIFEHVFSNELQKEMGHDFSSENGIDKKLTHILYHLQEQKKYIRGILSCESGGIFMMYFKQHLNTVFENHLQKGMKQVPKEYILNHMVCSFAETVRWWMTEHEEYSPEDISLFYQNTVPVSYITFTSS